MTMSSHGEVQVAASAPEVFRWLVEPAKLMQWAGGVGGMPDDPAKLMVGFTSPFTLAAPGAPGPATSLPPRTSRRSNLRSPVSPG